VGSAANWLCLKAARASAHLVIGRGGEIIQLVPFDVVAWHAREANKYSIGIELDNPGPLVWVDGTWRSLVLGTQYDKTDVALLQHSKGGASRGWLLYTQAQIKLMREIGRLLVESYPTIKDFVGHEDVSAHKLDPGPAWDMESLRTSVFGRE
jgi:N-acetylmuramoyl-L-alanine amidase